MESVLILLLKYKYLILFPLATFEGPIVSLVVGFLVFSGVFNFWLAFLILLLGDIIPDTIYYYIGYFSYKSKFTEKHFLKSKFFITHAPLVEKLWNKHPFKSIFLGKLAYGMSTLFLVSAGIVKMPYKKFISYALLVSIFQYGVIMFMGYSLGSSYAIVLKYVDGAYYIVGGLVLCSITIYVIIMKYARKKVEEMEKEE